jgi:hypothetical protein
MTHVFISYSRRNNTFADQLETELEAAGIDAWTDNDLEAGEPWRESIDNAIQQCFAVLAVMSEDAKKSEYVTYEWSYALGVGVTVIPLVLRKVTLHPKLEELQYLDFSGDFNAPFKKLLRRLKNLEIKYLQKTLRHPQYAIRRHAARRLGELKVRKAIPDLIRVLENDRSRKVVRPAAADALEAIGTDEAIKAAEKYRGNN